MTLEQARLSSALLSLGWTPVEENTYPKVMTVCHVWMSPLCEEMTFEVAVVKAGLVKDDLGPGIMERVQ